MDAHSVSMAPTQAHAFLGVDSAFHSFRFNPDNVSWNYQENTVSRDTIGGRVVQLLSVSIQGISVIGRAGSRGELQRLSSNINDIMKFHVRTSRPVRFKVPSRKWDFLVYVQALPQTGWEVASTSYPYQLQLAVQEDLSGVQSKKLEVAALQRLAQEIGYDDGFHGGDAKGYQQVVESILSARGAGSRTSDDSSDTSAAADYTGSITGITTGPTTASIIEVIRAVKGKFPHVTGGTYVCKKTASGGFSQHSAGNAWDIAGPDGYTITRANTAFYDEVFKFLKFNMDGKGLNLPISQVIWQDRCQLGPQCDGSTISGHQNHIHVSGLPYLNTPSPGCNP